MGKKRVICDSINKGKPCALKGGCFYSLCFCFLLGNKLIIACSPTNHHILLTLSLED
jgi:hypothetical protein